MMRKRCQILNNKREPLAPGLARKSATILASLKIWDIEPPSSQTKETISS